MTTLQWWPPHTNNVLEQEDGTVLQPGDTLEVPESELDEHLATGLFREPPEGPKAHDKVLDGDNKTQGPHTGGAAKTSS